MAGVRKSAVVLVRMRAGRRIPRKRIVLNPGTRLARRRASRVRRTTSGSVMARRVKTKQKGFAARMRTAMEAAREFRWLRLGLWRAMRNQEAMRIPAKTQTVRARAAVTEPPVNWKTRASTKGHTGSAAAGLKSPLTYQWPSWKWRMAASPYQPSSVYLDQSIQA